ncbi:MAG: PBECR2 nuclease fold domain-containing protein [Chloroherpetonaceae bacterium]|nr:PBECR2 nuclease fold domain-containing protein [Chloroherpetonaceae bacterium]
MDENHFFVDRRNHTIRLSKERWNHIETNHPELQESFALIEETLVNPDSITLSKSDSEIELYYKWYKQTEVGSKYLCVVVKKSDKDNFIVTTYFTNKIKTGVELWKKK